MGWQIWTHLEARIKGHATKADCTVYGGRGPHSLMSCPQARGGNPESSSCPREGTALTFLSLFPHLQSEGKETAFL